MGCMHPCLRSYAAVTTAAGALRKPDGANVCAFWERGSRFVHICFVLLQVVAMDVINPHSIDVTLDQIGGCDRIKRDLVRASP